MNRSVISRALAGACLLVLTGLGAPTLSAQEAAAAGALEEIIVTARKRDESLREIPESVSAISGFELAEAAEVQILFSPKITENTQSSGVQGTHSLRAALGETLAGTGLGYKFKSDDLVVAKGTSKAEREISGQLSDEGRRNGVQLVQLQASARESSKENDDDEDGEDEDGKEEEALQLDEQRVTGSRMKGGDPTTRVISFSAEDIARRGLSSTEEIFRDMAWAFASNTSQSNLDFQGPPDVDPNSSFGVFGLGTSSVNLRAMGSENTLVLLNGRRVGGIGGLDSNVVNLLNIPLSAIERVDIELGAASAIYGADAVGGVVNFITKKRHAGLEATYREEFSDTDADRTTMSLRGGYSWFTGSMTANVSYQESKPINNLKIWTSNDFRDQYGPEYDLRDTSAGQPGVVCEFDFYSVSSYVYPLYCIWPLTFYQLRPGHSGVGATVDDFTTEIAPFDYVTPYNGADSTTLSFNVRAEQYFGEDLMIYGEALYSEHDAFREMPVRLHGYLIPASNAYNSFGKDMLAYYAPVREVASGLFPPRTVETGNKQRTYNAGVIWRFGDSHELDLSLTRSDPRFFGVHSNHDWQRSEGDPSAKDFYLALESSDPSVALNVFGDGSAQGSEFAQFLYPHKRSRGRTDLGSLEAILRGNLFEVWGGPISYVIGGERRERRINYTSTDYIIGGDSEINELEYRGLNTSRPQVELVAGFMELGFPLVGERNARRGLRALNLSLQARRDNYTFAGAAGGVDAGVSYGENAFRAWVPGLGWTTVGGWKVQDIGNSIFVEKKKNDTSPRIGLQYKPADSVAIRTAWAQSFHPPSLEQQFNSSEPYGGRERFEDPLHPSGEPTSVGVRHIQALYNPNVKSEYGDKYSLSFDWEPETVPGLRWTVDWSRIEFTDKIESPYVMRDLYPETYFRNSELVPRDDEGNILYLYSHPINLSAKVSEFIETSIQYAFDTNFGTFVPRLTYSRPLEEYYQLVGAADPIERVSTVHGSDKYKLNGQLTWLWRKFAADLFVYFRPGYTNDQVGRCGEVVGRCEGAYQFRPSLELGSFTKIDLTLTYRFDNGFRVRTGGRNILKREAPTIYGGYGYDIVRWDARSRVLFLELHWAT